MDPNGKYFSVQYKNEETETILCLQKAFPTNNGRIVYASVHLRVGNCYEQRHKEAHIIPLVTGIHPKKDPGCL